MSGIGVISNPMSGRNRRNPRLIQRLAYVLGDTGEVAQPTGLDSLAEVARRFHEREVDLVCVNGGDGTNHKVMTALLAEYGGEALPRIAILRGGTMNTMARNLGIRGRPTELLGRVVAAWHSGDPIPFVEHNVLVVDGRRAGCLFGNGVLSRFLEAYYEGGDAGPWKAVKVLVRGVVSSAVGGRFARRLFAPSRFRVEVDGHPWAPEAYAAVAAGTLPDIGLGFKPFYRVKTHPDHLHVVGYACGALSVVRSMPRIYRGVSPGRDDILERAAKRFVISADEPVSYMVDGDFYDGGQTVTVEVGPRFRFVVL